MFKISPINDKAAQKQYATDCGVEFMPDMFAYSMLDAESGVLMGFSQFEIEERGGYINDIVPRLGYSDFEAMFILGRATMNFIDLCGKHVCYAKKNAGDERLLKCIGFKETADGELFADMNGMFDGNCGGHTVDGAN